MYVFIFINIYIYIEYHKIPTSLIVYNIDNEQNIYRATGLKNKVKLL